MSHVETVQQIYHAFGRGDVPAILEHLAADVEWEYGVESTGVPWLQPRRGKNEVPKFFEALAALEITRFEPTQILASGDTVVALIQLRGRVRTTGREIVEDDEVHVWRFDADGKVARFRHRVDSHQHWAAYTGATS